MQSILQDFDMKKIQTLPDALESVREVLNYAENLLIENQQLKEQVQFYKDEVNRLKGEQGKPTIKPNKDSSEKEKDKPEKGKPKPSNHSSEDERRRPKKRNKGKKKENIIVNETRTCNVAPEILPEDAVFKGYESVVVQDIRFETFNIEFKKEKYYSPSENKTYLADLPVGYKGEFGPAIKSLAIKLYFDSNITQPKLLDLFSDAGTLISTGQISNFLIKNQDEFHKEKDAIYEAGLLSCPWHHIDDTATRVNGRNQHCQILCNPVYTAFFTTETKCRLTILDVLKNFGERTFLLNDEAFSYFETFKLPGKVIDALKRFPRGRKLGQQEFLILIDEYLPDLGPQQYNHVLEAAAVSSYHAQTEFPIIRLLICDDAPQFKLLTEALALCWVHDGRHYKKLTPVVNLHRELLDAFLDQYWDFYRKLLDYQKNPTKEDHKRLDTEFDILFSTVTGYDALDDRIAKSKVKKSFLLMVLDHPEIKLHNNPAELEARKRVRKRVVSQGTRVKDGTKALDTFQTISATAKKHFVSFFDYIYDRISGTYKMPALADLIPQRAKDLSLAGSWESET